MRQTAHVERDLGAYALGALDTVDRDRVRSHLAGCARCQASLGDYQQVAVGLLHVLPVSVPPASLRDRVRKAIRRRSGESTWTHWGRAMQVAYPLLVGVLTVAVLVLSLTFLQVRDSLVRQQQNLQRLEADVVERARVDGVALALLSYPNRQVATVAGDGGSGTLVYEPRIPLVIINAWGLPDLAAGEVFQAWLVRPNGDRVGGGLFYRDDGAPFTRILLEASEPVSNFAGVGVTIEPEGGSPAPTGPNVLRAEF